MFLILVCGGGTVSFNMAFAQDDNVSPSLTVSGEGKAMARPDMAEIQTAVVTEADTAGAALEANSNAMQMLFGTIAKFDIEDRDVQTTAVNLAPRYARRTSGMPQRIEGYRAENRVRIRVRDLARLGKVLDALVTQGANTLHGIQFGVASPQPLNDQARRAAVADAQRNAMLYAKAAGVTLGRVMSLREMQVGGLPPRPPVPRAMAAEAVVPIAPGEMTFTIWVTMTYELVEP
jgi:uncharacterized protein YggE